MKKDNSFHEYVMRDFLGDISGITSRAMFGGWGVYKDGTIFGIIFDGELYFKVDKSNQADYEKCGSRPFEYARGGGQTILSYWLLPEEIMEDQEKLFEWAQISADISRRSKKNTRNKSKILL